MYLMLQIDKFLGQIKTGLLSNVTQEELINFNNIPYYNNYCLNKIALHVHKAPSEKHRPKVIFNFINLFIF